MPWIDGLSSVETQSTQRSRVHLGIRAAQNTCGRDRPRNRSSAITTAERRNRSHRRTPEERLRRRDMDASLQMDLAFIWRREMGDRIRREAFQASRDDGSLGFLPNCPPATMLGAWVKPARSDEPPNNEFNARPDDQVQRNESRCQGDKIQRRQQVRRA